MTFNGISILMPCLCRAVTDSWMQGFKRAAESVLSQESLLPFELLVIDDGSVQPLNSIKAIEPVFSDPRVRCIRLDRNSGLVFALNTGLTQAGYPLIARIDSDDAWRPDKLEKQLALFEADPDLTIVGTGMRLVHPDDPDKDENLVRPGSWEGILQFMAEIGCPFPHGSILARKDVFYLISGYSHDVRFMHCEDFALWSIWLRFFKGAMVEEVLYDYTVSDSAVSATCSGQQSCASGFVHQTYLNLNTYLGFPKAMKQLAARLGASVLETAKFCYLAWNFYDTVVAGWEELQLLQILMPDREVILPDSLKNHLGDRFLYFSRSKCPEGDHARCMHTLEELRPLLTGK